MNLFFKSKKICLFFLIFIAFQSPYLSAKEQDQPRNDTLLKDSIFKDSIVYRYRLVPEFDTWTEWKQGASFSFEHIKEGDYILEVQTKNSHGQTEDPVSFHFSVKQAVYKTWLAYVFYALLLGVLAFTLYKWRLLSLRKVDLKMSGIRKSRITNIPRRSIIKHIAIT